MLYTDSVYIRKITDSVYITVISLYETDKMVVYYIRISNADLWRLRRVRELI